MSRMKLSHYKLQPKAIFVVGINHAFHESSAAILMDGELVAAISEERFNRKKRGKEMNVKSGSHIPISSIEFCLKTVGIQYEDVAHWAFSFDPDMRIKHNLHWERYEKNIRNPYIKESIIIPGGFCSNEGEKLFYNGLKESVDILKSRGAQGEFHWIPHHISHAASSFYPSGFDESGVLVIDAGGEYESAWAGEGGESGIRKYYSVKFPNSIGFLWIKISELLGFGYYGAGKVMGLSAYGDPKRFQREMDALISVNNVGFSTNEERIIASTNIFTGIEDLFQIQKNKSGLDTDHKKFSHYADIAASLQEKTSKVLVDLVQQLRRLSKSRNLCLAGGVFLNCKSNQRIIESNLFDNIYIQPASTDDGTSVGAAFYVYRNIVSKGNHSSNKIVEDWSLGSKFSNSEIENELRKTTLQYKKSENIVQESASLLAQNKIIAWFQGRSEFGPRALGKRSILANVLFSNKDRINARDVKDRESFRPVGVSVLESEAKKYFNINGMIRQPYFFMLVTADINDEAARSMPWIKHYDDSVRIQVVTKKYGERYYCLLEEVKKITGVGSVINTSFNSSDEPMVNSPRDAIHTYERCLGIDYLVIGDYVVSRK